ncbi:MAG: DUF1540 domain-containing protein [Chloroflexi bacterium]|nr:DUF1540 domain-containing protein [Chloroflexota bacterium]
MPMTPVTACNVSQCVYNEQSLCHTPGINVGHHAECNTYFWGGQKGGLIEIKSGIGACQASDCRFNEQLECKAQGINVAVHNGHADCRTFQSRSR